MENMRDHSLRRNIPDEALFGQSIAASIAAINMICHDALDMFILRAIINLDAFLFSNLCQPLSSKMDIRGYTCEQDR